MAYILDYNDQELINQFRRLFVQKKIIERPESIIDIAGGDFTQELINLASSIIFQWIATHSAIPQIAIGPNENERLYDFLCSIEKRGRIKLMRLTHDKDDESISLEGLKSQNLRDVMMIILSAESGGIGIVNEIDKIYEYCTKNAKLLFGDLSGTLQHQLPMRAHAGVGQTDNGSVLYIDAFIVTYINYYHCYNNTCYLTLLRIGEQMKNTDFEDAQAQYKKFMSELKNIGVTGDALSRYRKKPEPNCLIICSSFSNYFIKESTISFAICYCRKIVPRQKIIDYLKEEAARGAPIPQITFSQIQNDSVKANAITCSFTSKGQIKPLVGLIKHFMK